MSKIVIIAGSNNRNLELSREFQKYFEQNNVASAILDLVSLNLPLYTPAEESKGIPEEVHKYKKILEVATGFVFSIPEYNGGIPPVVTNMLAWVSRSGDKDWRSCFNGKPAALASFSGSGGIQALASLRNQLSYIGMNTIGRQVRATFKQELNLQDVEAVGQLLLKSCK
jgi:NAD(P)H-dependent FMN reductase